MTEVLREVKERYPDLNYQTGTKYYIDLMIVVSRNAKTQEKRDEIICKISLANIISDAFSFVRLN
jgi:hypothetical protein